MLRLLNKLEAVTKGAVLIAFAVMIVSVLVQVLARSFADQPPLWTEEAARVALLYIVALGVGASVLTGDLVNVDLALMIMPARLRRACELLSAGLVSAFGFALVPGAWEYTLSGAMQTSPVLETPMQYIFMTMLLFSVLLGFFGLVRIFQLLSGESSAPATPD